MAPETTAAELSLAEGSARHTLADWERATAAVLRKSGRLGDDASDSEVWDKLTKQTLDGIDVIPLGTPALTADLPAVGLPGQSPYTRGSSAVREFGAWDIRAQFVDPDPKVTAGHLLTDLENGVNSLWLSVGPTAIDVDDLPELLAKIFIDLAPVILDAPTDPVAAAEALAAIFEARSIEAAPGTNLGANPIGAGADEATTKQIVTEVAAIATNVGARALVVDGTDVHDLGASDVQELAYSLAVGAAYLRLLVDAGHSVDLAAGLIEFRYAATDEQFPTIAKFRAARRLWNRVAELSGVATESRRQVQHGVTSRPMMSKYGSYVNMLRTTVASFAAGVGGAESVTVLPFDTALGLPENFSRRIARNTSSVLIRESHVATAMDPAGGAYVVEKLTDDLARAAWEAFGAIEEAGGIAAVIADGSLDAKIAETVKKRTGEIGKRNRQITGINEFPNLADVLLERRAYPEGTTVVARYGAPFEALRDEPAGKPVFLATMGTIAAHTARASFVTNLFAAAGIGTVAAGATAGVEDVVKAYDGSPVVCLAGTEAAYTQWGADLIAALRHEGAAWIILAGKPTDELSIDDSAATGVDALAFGHRTREHLDLGSGVPAPTEVGA